MIKTITLSVLLAFACSKAIAQKPELIRFIDSLKNELNNSKRDTNRVLSISNLCIAYQFSNPDSLDLYSKQGLELARQLHFAKGEAAILNSQGIALSFQGNIPKALELLFKGLGIAEKNNLLLEKAIILNSIGDCYWFLNDFSKGVDFINKARQLYKVNNTERGSLFWKIYIETWSGLAYSGMNKLDSAMLLLQSAYKQAYDPSYIDIFSTRPTILMALGPVEFKLGYQDSAFKHLHQCINDFGEFNDHYGFADGCYLLSGIFKEVKQKDSAVYYAKMGLDTAIKFDYKSNIWRSSTLLAELYDSTDIRQAYYYTKLSLSASNALFGADKIQELQKTLSEEQQRQQQIEEEQLKNENRIKQYAFLGGLFIMAVVAFFLYRNNRQKQKANSLLASEKEKVESTLKELKSAQAQLIQSEKMASLGELTAGIAHEIQNPLNFVNNFSEVNKELIEEMQQEIDKGNYSDVKEISNDIKDNEEKINHHGKRAEAIVKGMLQHSQSSKGQKEPTDINTLADEYLRLAYHGLRAKDKDFNATMKTEFDESISNINIIPQDIGRVLLNLYNNAFYAVAEKKKQVGDIYEPTISVSTKKINDKVEIKVADNGNGIPQKILDKIFQPFFTTKPTGQGTGLGLSLSYDIVKAHGGELKVGLLSEKVENKEGAGASFIILIPINYNK